VKGSVEHRYLRRLGQCGSSNPDPDEVCWVVQRREVDELVDRIDDVLGDQDRLGEPVPTMDDTVADGVECCAGQCRTGLLEGREDLVQASFMVGDLLRELDLLPEPIVPQPAGGLTDPLGQAAGLNVAVGNVDELVLDRRRTAVEHQDVLSHRWVRRSPGSR
jgi:hypothetical protein